MSYLEKFTAYSEEIGKAIRAMGPEFIRDLESEEVTCAAFTVCDAFSVFWWGWHGGQSSRLYALGSNFESEFHYKPSMSLGRQELVDQGDGEELYAHLCEAFGVEYDEPAMNAR